MVINEHIFKKSYGTQSVFLLLLFQENSFRRYPIASIRYILYTGKEPLRGAALFRSIFISFF